MTRVVYHRDISIFNRVLAQYMGIVIGLKSFRTKICFLHISYKTMICLSNHFLLDFHDIIALKAEINICSSSYIY